MEKRKGCAIKGWRDEWIRTKGKNEKRGGNKKKEKKKEHRVACTL